MLTAIITVVCLVKGFAAFDTVVLDRIAIVVGKRVIKTSDIDRDLRVTAFLNRSPLNLGPDARKKGAERLIDQQIIRQVIARGDYARASDKDAASLLNGIRKDRFAASDARLRAELHRYGLTEEELQAQLLWQLTVLRFINERFRPGIMISDDDVRKYYDEHLSDLKRQYPQDYRYQTLASKIRESLEGEQTNQQFERWLDTARKSTEIEYHQEALR